MTNDFWDAIDEAGWYPLDGGNIEPKYDEVADDNGYAGYAVSPNGTLYLCFAIPISAEKEIALGFDPEAMTRIRSALAAYNAEQAKETVVRILPDYQR